MQLKWILGGLCISWLCLGSGTGATAQSATAIETPTTPANETTRSSSPNSLTFTASTDQRFFFFNDTRTEDNRRVPVSVYGLRAGFLFPAQRERPALGSSRVASFKAGAGFYFVNQRLDIPGLLPGTAESVTRHLRIATVYYERYLLRRNAFEISLPVEFGYGHSRYERNDDQAKKYEVARGIFLPLGIGFSASYQFPPIRWFKPIHWFGVNVLSGYRFILKKDIPDSQINYTGLYISVGPSFFLENLVADVKHWRQKRKKKSPDTP